MMTIAELLEAVERGRTDAVHTAISRGLDRALSPEEKVTALQWCSYYGDVTACRLLVADGVTLASLGDDLGLNAAAFHGQWQLCEYLIEHGASAQYSDPITGETPLHSALTNEDRARYDLVVQVLLRAGADVNVATIPGRSTGSFMRDSVTRGETPLHRAALFGTESTIKLLLSAGADLEAKDAHDESPLAWASWARRPVEVLRALLFGPHKINPAYLPLRESLLGRPSTTLPGGKATPERAHKKSSG